jgi:hypothetical protein
VTGISAPKTASATPDNAETKSTAIRNAEKALLRGFLFPKYTANPALTITITGMPTTKPSALTETGFKNAEAP